MNSKKILKEIDSRLERLGSHSDDRRDTDGNHYKEILASEARLLNEALTNELQSLKAFIQSDSSR